MENDIRCECYAEKIAYGEYLPVDLLWTIERKTGKGKQTSNLAPINRPQSESPAEICVRSVIRVPLFVVSGNSHECDCSLRAGERGREESGMI